MISPVPDANAQTGGTRLKAIYFIGDDGSRQFSRWHDTELDIDCIFLPDQAGVLSCIPWLTEKQAIAYKAGYVDPLCTVPYFISLCDTAQYGIAQESTACGVVSREVYKIRPTQADINYYKKGPDLECRPAEPIPGYRNYIGDLKPSGTFVTAREVAQ